MLNGRKVEIDVNVDDSQYISDLLCWVEGFLEGKGEDYRNYYLLKEAANRIAEINRQLKMTTIVEESNVKAE